jgi:TRAP-type C4-dicarboxylate transport system permease small subunit
MVNIRTKTLVTDSNRCWGAYAKGCTMTQPPISTRTTLLGVGVLGSAATLVLRPQALVAGIAAGILVVCLVAVAFRALRHASRRIHRILTEELASTETAEQSEPRSRRKAA